MTTLNTRANSLAARANQAYREMLTAEDHIDGTPAFDTIPEAFEEGWETGYKQAARDIAAALEAIPGEVYPEDVFPPEGTSVDAHSARVMRVAYPAAARLAREVGGVTTDGD